MTNRFVPADVEGPGPLSSFVVGEGARPTVLLHGFLGSGRNLRSLALKWAAGDPGRRFLLPDLTGHGTSPPLPPGASLDLIAEMILETAARAGFVGPLSVAGHSLGGRVALAAARIAADRLADVALLDITPGPIDPRRSDSRRVLDVLLQAPEEVGDRRALRGFLVERGLAPALVDWVLMNLRVEQDAGQGPRYVWRLDRAAMDALHESFNGEDLWPVVEARPVPIRAVRGGRSGYLPQADVARLEAAGCPVATLPEAGHFVHVDAPDALVAWLCGR
jgi:pimeloyl-ACP methyl ester carboxylesterase